VLNGGEINVSTFSSGNGGKVTVRTDNLTINRQDSSRVTGIVSQANPSSNGGNGGELDITVSSDLNLFNGGLIGVGTFSSGNGGKVTVRTKNLKINGQGSSNFTGIASQAVSGSGNGGELDITASSDLNVLNGGEINVSTFSSGNGGNVTVRTDNLTINGQGSSKFTGIASQATSGSTGGNGGELDITMSSDLNVLDGGAISVSTFSSGNGGNVTVRTDNLTIDRQGSSRFTGISSEASSGATGNSGNLTITADDRLKVINAGSITSSTNSTGTAGSVTIDGGDLLLENGGSILSSSNKIDSPVDNLPDAGAIEIDMTGNIQLRSGSVIASSSELSNAGTIQLSADGDIIIDSSEISISAGQGILNERVRSNTRFTLDDPNGDFLNRFLSDFTPSELQIKSGSTIRVTDSDIDARAGLIAGSVGLKAADKIIVNNSDLSLEVDQRNMNLASTWDSFRNDTSGTVDGNAFSEAFPELFSELRLEAENAIQITDSQLTTNAGIRDDSGDAALDAINGFGGSIRLLAPQIFPVQISLLDSTLEARSYAMGGNVIIDPYYYIVNQSDVITRAAFIGGDYIINATFLLQSLLSTVDLSGQQSGDFVSGAINVDLGAALASLNVDFLNLASFSQASCDLYYAEKRSSFIVQPSKLKELDFKGYVPSAPPSNMEDLKYDAEETDEDESFWQSLPDLELGCKDCI
jgi:hypothetical protein